MAQLTGSHRALEEFLGPRFHIRVHRGENAFRRLARQISVCLSDDMIENDLFKALADPTRRLLLDALHERDGQTLTELGAGRDMTRFGVMKHLKLLEEAGLVATRR